MDNFKRIAEKSNTFDTIADQMILMEADWIEKGLQWVGNQVGKDLTSWLPKALQATSYDKSKEYYLSPFSISGHSRIDPGKSLLQLQTGIKKITPTEYVKNCRMRQEPYYRMTEAEKDVVINLLTPLGIGFNRLDSPKVGTDVVAQMDLNVGDYVIHTSHRGRKNVAKIEEIGPNNTFVKLSAQPSGRLLATLPSSDRLPEQIEKVIGGVIPTTTPPVIGSIPPGGSRTYTEAEYQAKIKSFSDAWAKAQFDRTKKITHDFRGSEDRNGIFDIDGKVYIDRWPDVLNAINSIYGNLGRRGYGASSSTYEIVNRTVFDEKIKRRSKEVSLDDAKDANLDATVGTTSEEFLAKVHTQVIVPAFVKSGLLLYATEEQYKNAVGSKLQKVGGAIGKQLMSIGSNVPTPKL